LGLVDRSTSPNRLRATRQQVTSHERQQVMERSTSPEPTPLPPPSAAAPPSLEPFLPPVSTVLDGASTSLGTPSPSELWIGEVLNLEP